MAYYKNNYEAYYRRIKSNYNVKYVENRKMSLSPKSSMSNIIFFDIIAALLFLAILIGGKNIQNKEINNIYNKIENMIKEENKLLENYNRDFYNEVVNFYNNIIENE